jgi:vacuolar-type H+-ATPase subunit H
MEGDVLAKILQAEREIRMKIDSAREICGKRVQSVREEAGKRIAQEEALIREECKGVLEEAEVLAQKRAAAFIETEARRAEKLSSLTDESLKRAIMQHIVRILPGEKHDRTHVQS